MCATVEDHAYARNRNQPRQVQRSNPNDRLRKDTVASMPARKRFKMRRTRGVDVISSIGTPAGFEKQTSRVPEDFSVSKFAFDAKPPSNAALSGGAPNTKSPSRRVVFPSKERSLTGRTPGKNGEPPVIVQRAYDLEEGALSALLMRLIQDYDDRHYPLSPSPPHKMIQYLMEQRGPKQADLLPVFGSRSVASDAFNGKRKPSKAHIGKLAKFFHVSPALFLEA